MSQTDVTLVLPDPGLDGTPYLTDIDLTILARHTVHTRNLESEIVLHKLKETRDLLHWWAVRHDVHGEQPADAVESCTYKGQEGN
jgi:hypothetical protein